MEREVKQIIVFRKDLLKGEKSIRKGKLGAQVAHASVGSLLQLSTKETSGEHSTIKFEIEKGDVLDKWLNGIFTKICLSVENDKELVELFDRIKSEAPHLPCVLITDCGKTEFNGVPTNTCIGIGPYWSDEIDKFTRDLKLL